MGSIGETGADFNYDLRQQIFCLSAAANAVGAAKGTQANLQAALEKALERLLHTEGLPGGWNVTWGPKVYKSGNDVNDPKTGPANVWYAAQSDSQKLVVVAIAGTAANSPEAWLKDDFKVEETVDFNDWVAGWSKNGPTVPPQERHVNPSGPYAAWGTCYGVSKVLMNTSPTKYANGKRIYEYLQSDVPAGYGVAFTGHSLGAALAPTVALGLKQSGLGGLGGRSVRIYPSGGATPGNAALASSISSAFPGISHLFNTYDMVPQAWGIDAPSDRNLQRILNEIYKNKTNRLLLSGFVDSLVKKARNAALPYWPLNGAVFRPQFTEPITGLPALMKSILVQHTDVYWTQLGISEFVARIRIQLQEEGVSELDLDETLDVPEVEAGSENIAASGSVQAVY